MHPLLSKQQCTAARGVAILSIMLHNYCHTFDFAIKESEFEWNITQTQRWCDYVHHIDQNVFIHIFSCFGYLGVAAFMFLAGYGLVRKYEHNNANTTFVPFVVKQYRKLLSLILLPLLAFVALQLLLNHSTYATPLSLLAQVCMVSNFMPQLKIIPFVYWYFSVMMQLYVLYAIMMTFNGRHARLWLPVLMIATGIVLHVIIPRGTHMAGMLRLNCVIAFVPFGMGLLAARYLKEYHLTYKRAALMLPVLLAMTVIFTFSHTLWGLIYGVGAAMFVCVTRLLKGRILKWSITVGNVSAIIFVLHPLARLIISHVAKLMPDYPNTLVMLYILLTALTVIVYNKLTLVNKINAFITGNQQKK